MATELAGSGARSAHVLSNAGSAEPAVLGSVVADLERTRQPFAQARTLPGAVYTSEEVFRREQRGLMAHHWLCVGREADLPAAGDYFLKEIAGDSIIVVRGSDGQIRAFYNVCRHRGSKLLDAPRGSGLARVLCPYHSWSYNLDGTLHTAPQMGENFRKAESALVPVRLGRPSRIHLPESRRRGAATRAPFRRPARSHALSHGRAALWQAHRIRRQRELETHLRELQRVLPLRRESPAAHSHQRTHRPRRARAGDRHVVSTAVRCACATASKRCR